LTLNHLFDCNSPIAEATSKQLQNLFRSVIKNCTWADAIETISFLFPVWLHNHVWWHAHCSMHSIISWWRSFPN